MISILVRGIRSPLHFQFLLSSLLNCLLLPSSPPPFLPLFPSSPPPFLPLLPSSPPPLLPSFPPPLFPSSPLPFLPSSPLPLLPSFPLPLLPSSSSSPSLLPSPLLSSPPLLPSPPLSQLIWKFVASEEDYVSQLTMLNEEFRQQCEIAACSRKPPITLEQSNAIFRNR